MLLRRAFATFGLATALVGAACAPAPATPPNPPTSAPTSAPTTAAPAASPAAAPAPSTAASPAASASVPSPMAATKPAAAGGPTRGVTADSLTFGASVPQSGPLAASGKIATARKAYFDYINSQGGVNGRKINYILYDDQYTPAKTVTNTKRLIEEDKVFAVVGTVGTANGQAILDYLNEQNVPFLFPVSGSGIWANPVKPLVFAFQSNYPLETSTFAYYAAKNMTGKKVGVIFQNDDFGREWVSGFEEALGKNNVQIVSKQPYTFGAPDLSPQVIALQQAGADVVGAAVTVDAAAKIYKAGADLDYKPAWLTSNVALSDALFAMLPDASAASTALFPSYFPRATDPQALNDALKLHMDIQAKYDPQNKPDDFTMLGFATGEIIVDALKRAGADLTQETFMAAMNSVNTFETGVTPAVSYSPADHRGIKNVRLFKVEGSAFTPVTPFLTAQAEPLR